DDSAGQRPGVFPILFDELKAEDDLSGVGVRKSPLIGRDQARANAVDARLHGGVSVGRNLFGVESLDDFAECALFGVGVNVARVVIGLGEQLLFSMDDD